MTEFQKKVAEMSGKDWDEITVWPVYQYGSHPQVSCGFIFAWDGPSWHFLVYRYGTWWGASGDEQCSEDAPLKEAVLHASCKEADLASLGFRKKS